MDDMLEYQKEQFKQLIKQKWLRISHFYFNKFNYPIFIINLRGLLGEKN